MFTRQYAQVRNFTAPVSLYNPSVRGGDTRVSGPETATMEKPPVRLHLLVLPVIPIICVELYTLTSAV